MRIAINAIPIQPGGGLTVLRGLVNGLRASRPTWRITVLTGNDATHKSVVSLGGASDVDRALTGTNSANALLWQNTRLGSLLRKRGVEVLIGFNHYQLNVSCPQIIYHLNLRRFSWAYRSRRPSTALQEELRDWLARRALRRADANVFESRFLRDAATLATGRKPRNVDVIYIGLPDTLLDAPDDKPSVTNESRRLVAITSPAPHKDNSTLIRTLARLARKEPQQDWHLDIVGGVDPAAWAPMRQLADVLGMGGRITWHGFRDHDAITHLLRGALCLISTSQLESFAMVALEAMAQSCPPIVANCAAMPESIGDAGLLAIPGTPASFADAVLRIASEPGLREQLVSRGYDWIRNFRWSRCGAAFAETIEALARNEVSPGNSRDQTSTAA
ncbi:MAG: glycosyltransferase family 4 protein [Pirellulales bacterium]